MISKGEFDLYSSKEACLIVKVVLLPQSELDPINIVHNVNRNINNYTNIKLNSNINNYNSIKVKSFSSLQPCLSSVLRCSLSNDSNILILNLPSNSSEVLIPNESFDAEARKKTTNYQNTEIVRGTEKVLKTKADDVKIPTER